MNLKIIIFTSEGRKNGFNTTFNDCREFKTNDLSNFQGLLCLWRGMLPALYRHAIYTGMRMSVYEEVRSTLQKENKVSNHKKFII